MPKRSSKKRKPKDLDRQAKAIVDEATSEAPEESPPEEPPTVDKHAAAVALGRLGGLKGGPARARKLSKKRRSEIARKAALKRWAKHTPHTRNGSNKSPKL